MNVAKNLLYSCNIVRKLHSYLLLFFNGCFKRQIDQKQGLKSNLTFFLCHVTMKHIVKLFFICTSLVTEGRFCAGMPGFGIQFLFPLVFYASDTSDFVQRCLTRLTKAAKHFW